MQSEVKGVKNKLRKIKYNKPTKIPAARNQSLLEKWPQDYLLSKHCRNILYFGKPCWEFILEMVAGGLWCKLESTQA